MGAGWSWDRQGCRAPARGRPIIPGAALDGANGAVRIGGDCQNHHASELRRRKPACYSRTRATLGRPQRPPKRRRCQGARRGAVYRRFVVSRDALRDDHPIDHSSRSHQRDPSRVRHRGLHRRRLPRRSRKEHRRAHRRGPAVPRRARGVSRRRADSAPRARRSRSADDRARQDRLHTAAGALRRRALDAIVQVDRHRQGIDRRGTGFRRSPRRGRVSDRTSGTALHRDQWRHRGSRTPTG